MPRYFLYTPRTGSKILPLLEGAVPDPRTPVTRVIRTDGRPVYGSHHIMAETMVSVEASVPGMHFRAEAGGVAQQCVRLMGGVAADVNGEIRYYAPTLRAARVALWLMEQERPERRPTIAPQHDEGYARGRIRYMLLGGSDGGDGSPSYASILVDLGNEIDLARNARWTPEHGWTTTCPTVAVISSHIGICQDGVARWLREHNLPPCSAEEAFRWAVDHIALVPEQYRQIVLQHGAEQAPATETANTVS